MTEERETVSGERGTKAVRTVLERAEQLAAARGAREVSSAHLVLAMLTQESGRATLVLKSHDVSAEALEERLSSDGGGNGRTAPPGPLAPAPEIAAAVANAIRRAKAAGRSTFDVADLLLSVLSDGAASATRTLLALGVDREKVASELTQITSQDEAIARAEAREAAHAPCPFHVGPGSCAVTECPAHDGPPAVPGLHGEVRELRARMDAMLANHRQLAERTEELVRYLRVLWVASLLFLAAIVTLAIKLFGWP